MCNETVAQIDERLAIAMKQVEVLRESRAHYIDARQNGSSGSIAIDIALEPAFRGC